VTGEERERSAEHLSAIGAPAGGVEAVRARIFAVILTGLLNDGSVDLIAVHRGGGVAVIQDPSDAEFPAMPQNALDAAGAHHCVPLKEVAPLLHWCASEPAEGPPLHLRQGGRLLAAFEDCRLRGHASGLHPK